MRYMLLIYLEENAMSQDERERCYVESAKLAQQLQASGQFLAAAPLQPVAMATNVQMRDGNQFVIDGPFIETREQLGGFYLIDAKDLDEAIGIAGQIPGARYGTVEIRPVIELAGLPKRQSK